jgi:dihydrofolate reductase
MISYVGTSGMLAPAFYQRVLDCAQIFNFDLATTVLCNNLNPQFKSMSRKLILYIATSLDGYIAAPNDDLSFLDAVAKEGEDYGYGEFIQTIDTVIIGRKTYDWIMAHVPEFVHADKDTYVITRTPREQIGNTRFYTGDMKELVARLKSEEGKNIFVDGGAEVVNALLLDNLIDEFVISVIPVLLGAGVRLFKDGCGQQGLELVDVKGFKTGLVQMQYRRK